MTQKNPKIPLRSNSSTRNTNKLNNLEMAIFSKIIMPPSLSYSVYILYFIKILNQKYTLCKNIGTDALKV